MSRPNSTWRKPLGSKLEKLSHDVFDGFRWVVSVSAARFVALETGSTMILILSYVLSVVLFLFMVAVFLLRDEIVVMHKPTRTATVVNMMVNVMVCVFAFGATLWVTYEIVDTLVLYKSN